MRRSEMLGIIKSIIADNEELAVLILDTVEDAGMLPPNRFIVSKGIDVYEWELEPLPKEKKKIKYYAYVSRGSLHTFTKEFNLYYSDEDHSPYGFRVPNLDQEIEVDE